MVQRSLYVPVEKPVEEDEARLAVVPRFEHAKVIERISAASLDASAALPLVLGLHFAAPELHLAWIFGAWLSLISAVLCARDVLLPGGLGRRVFSLRLLDERLDLLADRPARLRRNLSLALPVISWTTELIVLWRVTGTQRIGDQWAKTAVAAPADRKPMGLRAVALLFVVIMASAATALIVGA